MLSRVTDRRRARTPRDPGVAAPYSRGILSLPPSEPGTQTVTQTVSFKTEMYSQKPAQYSVPKNNKTR